jgi:tetratricopeptide (TPR) repeat protein
LPDQKDVRRLGVVTLDYIAWLLSEPPEVAVKRFAVLVGSDEAGDLLRQAGAPGPWRRSPMAFGVMMMDGGNEMRMRRRAQDAMDELRRVLPTIIEIDVADSDFFATVASDMSSIADSLAEDGDSLQKSISESLAVFRLHEERNAALQQIADALEKLQQAPELAPRRRLVARDWHRGASELFRYYQAVVDPSSRTSADGPAVRFIQAALCRLGDRRQELSAIDKALRRYPVDDALANQPVIPP